MIETEPTPVRPSMKERQRELRENAILDAAIEFLQTKGFNAMTLEDITESIGISRPTLYQHFSSKEEMVVHIILRNMMRGLNKMRELSDDPRSPLDRLTEFLDWSMESRFGSCRCVFTDLANLVTEAKEKNPKYRAAHAEFKERFVALVRAAQEAGEVRQDIPAPLLAETVMSIYKSPAFDDMVQKGQTNTAEIRQCIFNLLKPA